MSCYNGILHLPLKYNAMAKFYDWKIEKFKGLFTKEEIENAWENPLIIHYADKVKPWEDASMPLADHWWNALGTSPVFGKYFEMNKERLLKTFLSNNMKNYIELENRCRESEVEVARIKNGVSYKVSRIITWLPRKLLGK
jgi:lipopolysaccharide biosynthesis glycosyltransferase